MSVIKEWHKARGWNTVGYHYFIKKDGTLQSGRDLEEVPAAQKGFNVGSIAICLHGLESFTEEQFRTLYDLCESINLAYGKKIVFRGHCEVNPDKTCPVFNYKEVLGINERGYIT